MNDFWSNLGSSLTGNIPKAVLCVRDKSKTMTANRRAGTGIRSRIDQMFAADNVKSTLASANTFTAGLLGNGNMLNSFVGTTNKAPSYEKRKKAAESSGFFAMEVQYNPATISFDTVAGKQVMPAGGNMGPGANNQIYEADYPVATTMNVQLIFDDVTVSNAFSTPDSPLTVGGLENMGASLARKVMGKEYTVQPQMDGIMSLLTLIQTRQVIFAWSKFYFRGELCNVSSRYTMFNTKGNPIRGVIDMSIRQEAYNSAVDSNLGTAQDDKYWDEAFERAFKEGQINGAKSFFSKATNNSILNLNL